MTDPVRPSSTAASLTLVAMRSWRIARDNRQPVQPALFAILNEYRAGVLAPTFDSLLRCYEACTGRLMRIGSFDAPRLSADEQRLLDLLESPDRPLSVDERRTKPGLVPSMRVALQSTRLMIRNALTDRDTAYGMFHPA